MTGCTLPILLAQEAQGGFSILWDFLKTGGFVMGLLVLCSVVAVACMITAAMQLREQALLPREVSDRLHSLADYAAKGDISPLQHFLAQEGSLLARMGALAVSGTYTSKQECTDAVASKAKLEIHKLETGLPVLEVMVTIAPLLGLLGTTIGLVGMFTAYGDGSGGGPDTMEVAKEIGVALKCTIAGLFVAVPSVVAHVLFMRKLDSIAVKLEGVLQETIHSFYHYFEVSRPS
jgi:biopolymer transport protein ExbB